MIKLINILREITEGKQVGTLYHYTFTWYLYKIIKTNTLESEDDWVSFTRSKDKNQFEISQDSNCVIVVDGDKLSNKYKIKPFQDLGFISIGGVEDEMEERVLGPINDLNKYIIKIIIYITHSYDDDQSDNKWVSKNILQTEELLKEKNIPYEIIKL
jgi:hypothetical protein